VLDSKLLRADAAGVAANLARRGFTLDVTAFNALEERRKSAQVESDRVRAERNANAKAVGMAKGKGEDASALLKRAEELTNSLAASDAAILESAVPSLGYGLSGGSAIPDASPSAAAYQPAATGIAKATARAAAPSAAPSAAASTESVTSIAASAPPASRAADLAQATATADTPVPTRKTTSPNALVFTSLLLLVGGAMLVLVRAASRRVTPV